MKTLYCILILMTGVIACKNGKTETTQADDEPKASTQVEKEVDVFYNKKDSLMYVKRYVTNGNTYSQLSYVIDLGPFMYHKNLGKIDYPDEEAFKKSKLELSDYNWKPKKGEQVLVVQVKHHAFKTDSAEIAAGEEIKNKVNERLRDKGAGMGGTYDKGDDGLNITFIVEDIDESLKIIMDVLEDVIGRYSLDVKTAIARKVLISDDKWFFEVLYPQQFTSFFSIY
jgi:hypothetical protein